MTFAQFCNELAIVPAPYGKPDSVARLVFADDIPDKWALFHLDDYRVSSAVSGPGYVLVPRTINALES